MLHFLGLYTPDRQGAQAPPSPEQMDRMRRFVEQAMQAGWLIQTGPIMFNPNNARVKLAGGTFTVTDDPAPERREAGFALLRANSREEIVEKCKTFLAAAGGGEADLFEIMAPPPQATV